MTENEIGMIINYAGDFLLDLSNGSLVKRHDIEFDFATVKVYTVGKNYRIDIIPNQEKE